MDISCKFSVAFELAYFLRSLAKMFLFICEQVYECFRSFYFFSFDFLLLLFTSENIFDKLSSPVLISSQLTNVSFLWYVFMVMIWPARPRLVSDWRNFYDHQRKCFRLTQFFSSDCSSDYESVYQIFVFTICFHGYDNYDLQEILTGFRLANFLRSPAKMFSTE